MQPKQYNLDTLFSEMEGELRLELASDVGLGSRLQCEGKATQVNAKVRVRIRVTMRIKANRVYRFQAPMSARARDQAMGNRAMG